MTAIAKRIKAETELQKLVDFVAARYIADGVDSSVKEIAAGLGWSAARVRNILAHDTGRALSSDTVRVSSRSRDYPMFYAGAHNVRLYGPSRTELAARVRASDFAAAKLDTLLKATTAVVHHAPTTNRVGQLNAPHLTACGITGDGVSWTPITDDVTCPECQAKLLAR